MVMPLGALANKLVKIEGDLRFLSMKAAEHSDETGAPPTQAVNARLDLIHESLDAIQALLVKLQADMHPKRHAAAGSAARDPADAPRHKPRPEHDD